MIDYLAENLWILWCLAAAVFLLVELATTALVSVWFIPSAVICAIISVFWHSFIAQVVIFLVLSGIFLYLCRKYYKPSAKKKLGEANELLVGKIGIADTDINSLSGTVTVGDVYWRAVSDSKIPKGAAVEVTNVNGTVLKVIIKQTEE